MIKLAFSECTRWVTNFGMPGLAPSSKWTSRAMDPMELLTWHRYSPKNSACVTGSYVEKNGKQLRGKYID